MKLLETKTFRSVPRSISELTSFVTGESDLFVLAHLGILAIPAQDWSLDITGMVDRPMHLKFGDLAAFPAHAVTSVHKCAGNPMKPAEPTPDRIGNVVWRGVRLRDVLAQSGCERGASHVWADGYDAGTFEGVVADSYQKDLPLAKAMQEDVLLATHVNDEPLSAHRGGPVRLIVPGWYATNSVKWLRTLRLADRRAPGPFTTTWYNDTRDNGERRPVWSIAPDSAIVAPVQGARLTSPSVTITGWSWGDQEIANVDVSIDGGLNWYPTELASRTGRSWQAFRATLAADAGNTLRIVSRATDVTGQVQPMSGARNASVVIEAFA